MQINVLQMRNSLALLYIHATDASFSLTRWQHSTLQREMTSWPPSRNYDVKSKIRLNRSTSCTMHYSERAQLVGLHETRDACT